MSNLEINSLKFREIVLNAKKPLVFKQFPIDWPCFDGSLEKWCKTFDESNYSSINFERIAKNHCYEPQWERKRQSIEITAMEFYKEHNGKECDHWSALNYKRKDELPAECTRGIDFSVFGFPQATDYTLWLSSTGANTPCHYDSYGCNIVVQIFGKKSWLLFPPNTTLTTTRIPYEESSIYCKENFYNPSTNIKNVTEKLKDVSYHIILEPKDVLIVPKHWWHYVETVEISLNVNSWIPLKSDKEVQIEECIVKYIIENLVKNTSTTARERILNPNQLLNIFTNEEILGTLFSLLKKSLENDLATKVKRTEYDYHYLTEVKVEELLKDFKCCVKVSPMSSIDFEKFLETNSLRFENFALNNCEESSLDYIEEILINSICNPKVVETMKNDFLKRYKEKI